MQRLGKDISFLIRGSYQKSLEWYILTWMDLIFFDCLSYHGVFLFLFIEEAFVFFWKLRLLAIKDREGLLSQGFVILDGLMVNLLFLMERSYILFFYFFC